MNPFFRRRFALASCVLLLTMGPSCLRLDGFMFNREKTDAYVLEDPTVPKNLREEVSFLASDGVRLWGVLARQADARAKPTLLYFHGNARNIDYYWSRVSRLWSFGFNVFIYDYRGYGKSEGTSTEEGLYQDGLAALEWLKGRADIDGSRIGYYGYSMGGAMAIDLASRRPPRAILTESTFSSAEALAADGSLVLPPSFLTNLHVRSDLKVARVGAPLLVIHGLVDDFVQPKYAGELMAAAVEPKSLVYFEGADHDTVPYVDPEKYRRVVTEFFTPALKGTLPSP